MSDRLTELQRQRALAQEQLAWFDREIARESGGQAASPAPSAPVGGIASPSGTLQSGGESPAADTEAEKILERFRHTGHPVRDEVKRGCFLYFFAAFGLLIFGLAAFWFLRRH